MRDLGADPTLPFTYHRRYPSPVHHDSPCNQSTFCGREFEEEREGVSSSSPSLLPPFLLHLLILLLLLEGDELVPHPQLQLRLLPLT